ncbi:transcription antiterminator [Pediococcus parvulus]|uniref:BglG family transcription antiterminator n=1 Tax=Pediococcus parvulus TaxID=54062 RepID=UPI00345EBDE5
MGTDQQRQIATETFVLSFSDEKNYWDNIVLPLIFPSKLIQSVDEVYSILTRRYFSDLPSYYLNALRVITMTQIYCLSIFGCDRETRYLINADTEVDDIAERLFSMISERFPFRYRKRDIKLLAQNLSAYRLGYKPDQLDSSWDVVVDSLLERMEAIQRIDFLGREQLKNQLLYHVPAMVLRLKQGMTVQNSLLGDIKKQYPALFGMTWYALSFLEERFGISLNDDEVSFITIYFHVALNKNIARNNVLIVFGKHGQLQKYVESQVEQLLPANTRVLTTTIDEFNNISLTTIGLIIEVEQLPFVVHVPQIVITPLMDSKDQANILKSFAEFVVLQGEENIHFPILKSVIDENLIFWKGSINDKREALDFLITKLEKREIVKSNFRNSIYRRERLGSTEIEGGSALPHAAPDTVLKKAIAILVLKKPVWWNTEKVQIIIIICMPNKQIKHYRELILDVYRLVKNKQMVQLISSMNSTRKFLKMINE